MINGVTHAHLGPIWYHIEPSDVPYSPNQFLGWDFFCCFHFFHNLNLVHIQSKLGLVLPLKEPNLHQMIKSTVDDFPNILTSSTNIWWDSPEFWTNSLILTSFLWVLTNFSKKFVKTSNVNVISGISSSFRPQCFAFTAASTALTWTEWLRN